MLTLLQKKNTSKDVSVAKLNKNRVKLNDIVFVNMKNVTADDFVGKIKSLHEGTKVVVIRSNRLQRRVFINRCSHANETQRKEYFKGVLQHG